jgi:hypothetical protein
LENLCSKRPILGSLSHLFSFTKCPRIPRPEENEKDENTKAKGTSTARRVPDETDQRNSRSYKNHPFPHHVLLYSNRHRQRRAVIFVCVLPFVVGQGQRVNVRYHLPFHNVLWSPSLARPRKRHKRASPPLRGREAGCPSLRPTAPRLLRPPPPWRPARLARARASAGHRAPRCPCPRAPPSSPSSPRPARARSSPTHCPRPSTAPSPSSSSAPPRPPEVLGAPRRPPRSPCRRASAPPRPSAPPASSLPRYSPTPAPCTHMLVLPWLPYRCSPVRLQFLRSQGLSLVLLRVPRTLSYQY